MYIRKSLFISKLALGLVVGYLLFKAVFVLQRPAVVLAPSSAVRAENSPTVATTKSPHTSLEDCSIIIQRSIFGTAEPSLGANGSAPLCNTGQLMPSAERELGLELVGTISGTQALSRAIIKNTKTNGLHLYRLGQKVAGALIESIEKNAVILLHNGQSKMLILKSSAGTGAADSTPAHSPKPAEDTNKVPAPELVAPTKQTPEKKVPEQTPVKITTRISCVEDILKKAVIKAYVVNGQTEGLKITGLEKLASAKALGLKNGDIIRQVNGQRLTGMRKAFQVFQKARSRPTLTLELLRGGETKKLSFTLQ